MATEAFEEIADTFEFLDDWEERYRHVLELGKAMDPLADAFRVSVWMTLVVFFGIGALKSLWAMTAWWRSGLETLGIGGVAAALAYVVGALFHV